MMPVIQYLKYVMNCDYARVTKNTIQHRSEYMSV